jgi:hypothetical protein
MVMVVVPWRSGDFQAVCVRVSAIEGKAGQGTAEDRQARQAAASLAAEHPMVPLPLGFGDAEPNQL